MRDEGGRKKVALHTLGTKANIMRSLFFSFFFFTSATLLQQGPQRRGSSEMKCLSRENNDPVLMLRPHQPECLRPDQDRPGLHIPFIRSDLCGGCDVGRRLLSTSSMSHGTRNSLCADQCYLQRNQDVTSPHIETCHDDKPIHNVKRCKSLR